MYFFQLLLVINPLNLYLFHMVIVINHFNHHYLFKIIIGINHFNNNDQQQHCKFQAKNNITTLTYDYYLIIYCKRIYCIQFIINALIMFQYM